MSKLRTLSEVAEALRSEVELFNLQNPVGSEIFHWAGARRGRGIKSTIARKAEVIDGRAVVYVEGHCGSVPLSRVKSVNCYDDVADSTVPSAGDPSWQVSNSPTNVLKEFLSLPRTMDEISAWGREKGFTQTMTKNTLAWLSIQGKIEHDPISKKWKVL